MGAASLFRRLQGRFWQHSVPLRRLLRRLRRRLALDLHRARRLIGAPVGTRVAPLAASTPPPALTDPAVGLAVSGGESALSPPRQTEPSLTADPERAANASFLVAADGGFGDLPTAHLEAMVMAAAAEGLPWVAAGWSPPAPGRFGPSGRLWRDPAATEAAHLLLRRPTALDPPRSAVSGRALPHITTAERCAGCPPLEQPAVAAVGPYRLRPNVAGAAVVRQPVFPVDRALAELPPVDGPSTVVFLLPYLAVGGAERLLFDLMTGLQARHRLLVATTDPHLEALGQTVDRARELTPHVYTLGDWLPRDAVGSAIRHLVRRWRADSLVCWNGSVTFYDEVANLRREFPGLRLVNQLFNHRGGWIEHYTQPLVRDIDLHIAINTPIARALVSERGVPPDRVATIHHAVGPAPERCVARRANIRGELGLADDTVLVGTFIRMHLQKRPLDVVRLARRMTTENVHFLLVGGGPLDPTVDRDLGRDPPPNLTRWPLRPDASALYDALDLCLLTSAYEGLPVFLLDGMARGIPCVATAVGDVPLLLDDGGGLVVDRPGDIDALATAVRGLLDPERRRLEGERARRTVVERFGLDTYVAAYESVIFPGTT